ncbi:MAG: MetS family NSS transporter small subunit [Planctomycetota bacterium]|nr:MetS family NSS transporter small subunit [Planctomycetota bacterium]
MSTSAVVLMILIPGILWGGFGLCLFIAVRKEGRKPRST